MISWMFERCNRRFEDAMQAGDTTRAQTYNRRRADSTGRFHELHHSCKWRWEGSNQWHAAHHWRHQQSWEQPHERYEWRRRSSIYQDESRPSGHDYLAGRNGHATARMWCDWIHIFRWFMVWSCFPDNMDCAFDWILMVHDALWQEPQHCSGTVVSWHSDRVHWTTGDSWIYILEGLVTWTLARVRGRLRRAAETGNIGAAMRYQQMQRWLESCLRHLPTASLQDREKTLNSLSDEYELSEDDNSPTYNLGRDERNLLSNSHDEIHKCILKLLELQRVEMTMDLLRTFAEIFRTPEVPDPDSDESMHVETQSERLRRYRAARSAIQMHWPCCTMDGHLLSLLTKRPKKNCKNFEEPYQWEKPIFRWHHTMLSLRWDTGFSSLAVVPHFVSPHRSPKNGHSMDFEQSWGALQQHSIENASWGGVKNIDSPCTQLPFDVHSVDHSSYMPVAACSADTACLRRFRFQTNLQVFVGHLQVFVHNSSKSRPTRGNTDHSWRPLGQPWPYPQKCNDSRTSVASPAHGLLPWSIFSCCQLP